MENLTLLSELKRSSEFGPPASWPVEMRSVVETSLRSTFPICLAWGEDLIQIYNDAYNRIFGEKHPASFGAPAATTWPEIWEFLKPALDKVRLEKKPHEFSNYLLPIRKTDAPEECYFTFCYSPIVFADGTVPGVIAIAMETTAESIAMRRQPLTSMVIDARPDDEHPISTKLRELLTENELDAKAAFIAYPVDPSHPIEWSIRCDIDTARSLLNEVERQRDGRPAGIVVLDAGQHRSEFATYLAFIRFESANGAGTKTLVLWPSTLVTEESIADLIPKLSRRLQTASNQLRSLNKIKEELVQGDLLYRFLFENTVDGVIYSSTNDDGTGPETIIAANNSACEMLGYPPEEIVGMMREDFFFNGDEELQSAIHARSQQQSFTGELTFKHKSGIPLNMEITSVLAQLSSGKRRSISIIRDLSKKLQTERTQAERTRLETVGQMTSGISHDFNNLLTVILSAAEHLKSSSLDPALADVVGDIVVASNRATILTSQLLAYSGRQHLNPELVELNSTIKDLERILRGASSNELTLRIKYTRAKVYAYVDMSLLTSSLINLVKNAGEAPNGSGRVEVVVGTHVVETPPGPYLSRGRYATIAVVDDGPGIPPANLKRVFDPFYTTKRTQGGSGLGLSMVQGFARQSGGEVLLDSTVGVGTVATLYFPYQQAKHKHSRAVVRPKATAPKISGHVLVVDDDPLIRRQIGRVLTAIGMKFTEAGSAAEALEFINEKITIVITDMIMPGELTGSDVLRACRQSNPPIPAILMSGYADAESWKSAIDSSTPVLVKPFRRHTLVEQIEMHIGR
jgi:PAS domain S-box-containing protein